MSLDPLKQTPLRYCSHDVLLGQVCSACDFTMEMEKPYRPVFAGFTPDGERIILYKHFQREAELHIQRPDGELWALSPGSEVHTRFEMDTQLFHIQIKSPEWSGTAAGSRWDLEEAERR